MQPTLLSNGACGACLQDSVEALAASENWSSPDTAKARMASKLSSSTAIHQEQWTRWVHGSSWSRGRQRRYGELLRTLAKERA